MKKLFFASASLAICLMLAGCFPLSSFSDQTQSTSSTGPSTPGETAPPSTLSDSNDTALTVGNTGKLGNWEITLTEFKFTEQIDNGYSYFSPDEGSQFALVSLTVVNKDTQPDTFLPYLSFSSDTRVKILYNNDYEYSSTALPGYDADLTSAFFNPLVEKNGCIAFQIPDSVVNSTESLVLTFSLGSEELSYNLR